MSYSLTISWTAASPAPAAGYRLKYWPTSNPSAITTVTPNISGTTYTINDLTETSYAGTVESDCGSGQYSSPVNWSASFVPPPPTYYYYTGILCGGSIQESFRSTTSNLDNNLYVVKAMCAACGNTEQCFDNVSSTLTPNTNDVIATYDDCASCTGGGSTPTITNSSAGFEPCIGGTVDDHLGGQVILSGPVSVDTNFTIDVIYAPQGSSCANGTNTVSISGTILAGQSSGNIDACTSGMYLSGGGTVCSTSAYLY